MSVDEPEAAGATKREVKVKEVESCERAGEILRIEVYREGNSSLWGYCIQTKKDKYTYTAYSSEYEAILGLTYRLEVLAEEYQGKK